MRQYPSKLLLFGEYVLLLGARALAVPAPFFYGKWAQGKTNKCGADLTDFVNSPELAGVPGLDLQRFRADLQAGYFFESNIPQGYGLGSSGALCAAVYDRYAVHKATGLSDLKNIFAGMENYFHGQSSGIDPLTSYLNRALWIKNRVEVRFFDAMPSAADRPEIFLLDTCQSRQTGPLVQWFLEKSRLPDFAHRLETAFLPAHEALLNAWENNDWDNFWPSLHQVSAFQLAFMPPMIPEAIQPAWANCLNGDQVFLKICGAGGGGFMLGFAQNKKIALEKLSAFTLLFPFEQDALVEK